MNRKEWKGELGKGEKKKERKKERIIKWEGRQENEWNID
jgi:hypothetical protein